MRKEIRVTIESRAGGAVLRVDGDLDVLACPALLLSAERELGAGVKRLVLDLAHVRFLGSTGLESIFDLSRRLALRGGGLAVARAAPFCRKVMEQVGLDRCVVLLEREEEIEPWIAGPLTVHGGQSA